MLSKLKQQRVDEHQKPVQYYILKVLMEYLTYWAHHGIFKHFIFHINCMWILLCTTFYLLMTLKIQCKHKYYKALEIPDHCTASELLFF